MMLEECRIPINYWRLIFPIFYPTTIGPHLKPGLFTKPSLLAAHLCAHLMSFFSKPLYFHIRDLAYVSALSDTSSPSMRSRNAFSTTRNTTEREQALAAYVEVNKRRNVQLDVIAGVYMSLRSYSHYFRAMF